MHEALTVLLYCVAIGLALIAVQVAVTAIRKHQSPLAILSADEKVIVADFRRFDGAAKLVAARGEAIAEGVIQRVDADVISILHKAETEGTLIEGTVKAYVEKFLGITQTPAPALAAAPAPAPAPAPEPATLTISGTPEQIAAATAAVQASTGSAPVILHAAAD